LGAPAETSALSVEPVARSRFAPRATVQPRLAVTATTSVLGRVPEVTERLYAISVERKLKNPAIVAISEAARLEVFA
jgi:LysR family transcriptional regulator, transcriptional activator of nhaA